MPQKDEIKSRKVSLSQIKTGTTITTITQEIINQIPMVKAFDSYEMNNQLYELHKKLLTTAMNKNSSYEVGIFWNLLNPKEYYVVLGSKNGIDISQDKDINDMLNSTRYRSIAMLHNHPRNTPFSDVDLSSFARYESIYLMTAVCNDGKIHMIRKEQNFNKIALRDYYSMGIIQNKDKKHLYYGMNHVARSAKEIGVKYRCSVKRKGDMI